GPSRHGRQCRRMGCRLLARELQTRPGRRCRLVQPRGPRARGARRLLGRLAGPDPGGVAPAGGFGRDQRAHRLPRGAWYLTRERDRRCAWIHNAGRRPAGVAVASVGGCGYWWCLAAWSTEAATTCPTAPRTPTPARRC